MHFSWIRRRDLIAVRHDAGSWVVKDPISLSYTLLDDTEYAVLSMMDGMTDFRTLLRRVQRLIPEQKLTADDLAGFVTALAGNQLIRQTTFGDARRLSSGSHPSLPSRVFRGLSGLLRLRLTVGDPTWLLNRTLPWIHMLFQRATMIVMSILVIAAAIIAVTNFEEIRSQLPTLHDFTGPSNLLLMLGLFVTVKLFHEAGHACTARYFGADCSECGIMLLLLTPVLYTNVTDSWMLPRKQRLLVSGAGILVELTIAAAATLLWWQASPGLTQTLLLNLMLICSLNTLLFNGNPLLKFDGYYLLTDGISIPNLASRAAQAVQDAVVRCVTGHQTPVSDSPRVRWMLFGYGLMSVAYRAVLTLAILQLIDQAGKAWHVELAAAVLSVVIVVGFAAMPLFAFGRRIVMEALVRRDAPAAWLRTIAFLAVPVILLFVPLPHSVNAPAVVQPGGSNVYAELSGLLEPVAAYGNRLQQGDVIARVSSTALDRRQLELQHRIHQLELQIDAATSSLQASTDLIPALQESLRAAQTQLDNFSVQYAGLTITSPGSGPLLPPRRRQPTEDSDALPPFWNGCPLDSRNRGAWLERGVLLGCVGDARDSRIMICIDEADIDFLELQQHAEFRSSGGTVIAGTVQSIDRLPAAHVPVELAITGSVRGRLTDEGLTPDDTTYVVTMEPDVAAKGTMPPIYAAGTARISTRPLSITQRFARYIRRTFR